jgi:predicted membrane chloride channel (bestrophin family)
MSDKNGSSSESKPDVAALRAEIAQTRADLGETVQALAAKADVKARAKDQVEQTKQKVRVQAAEATQKATHKAREAAGLASGKVRTVASQASVKARDTAVQVRESGALDKAQGAKEQVRRNPVPFAAVLAAVAVVGVILIIRGRRR